MPDRSEDWLKQAKLDIEHAEESLKLEHYEWSCLAAQQAAERAIKALFQNIKSYVWGHSVSRLLKKIPTEYSVPENLFNDAKILDRHYVPTRYPNGLISGTPREYFTLKDAKEAIRIAGEVIRFCSDNIR